MCFQYGFVVVAMAKVILCSVFMMRLLGIFLFINHLFAGHHLVDGARLQVLVEVEHNLIERACELVVPVIVFRNR